MRRKGKGYKAFQFGHNIWYPMQPVHLLLQITTVYFNHVKKCITSSQIYSNLLFIKSFNATQVIHAFSTLPGTKKACERGSHWIWVHIVSKRPFKRDAERAAHTHFRQTWSDKGFDCKWLELRCSSCMFRQHWKGYGVFWRYLWHFARTCSFMHAMYLCMGQRT